jgi:hypothetical protein
MSLLDQVSSEVMERTGGGQRPVPIGTVGSDVFVVDVHGGRILPGPNPDGVKVTLRSVVEKPFQALASQVWLWFIRDVFVLEGGCACVCG